MTQVAYHQIPKDVKPMCKIRLKSIILWHFLGISENLEEVKVTLDVDTIKMYELNILPTHQNRQLVLDNVFLEKLGLGDNQFWWNFEICEKMQKSKVVKTIIL